MFRRISVIFGGLCLLGGLGGCSASQSPAETASADSSREVGTPAALPIEMPAVGRGRIRLTVTPIEAEIAVDGVTQGLASDFVAPAYIELDPGTHRIEVRLPGFETYRAEVHVAADVTETIPVNLRRLPAMPKDPDDKDKEIAP